MSFDLFDFQKTAVRQLQDAIAEWVQTGVERGRPPTTIDGEIIPFMGHMTAITGAGKTPILASVVAGIGPAIVIWTTNRSVVVDQTATKLGGVYRHLLPPKTSILGEVPVANDWRAVVDQTDGLTIWCMTVGKWNALDDSTKNTKAARLSVHRTNEDIAGTQSSWAQLSDVQRRGRPVWVVYDESQGVTDAQLDQLLALNPIGILAASGTPRFSPKLDELRETLVRSQVYGPIAARAMIDVATVEVARAGLLKSEVEMVDLNMTNESRVAEVVEQLTKLDDLVAEHELTLRPLALYVTEESNRSGDGDPRPVVIWKALVDLGVPPSAIALATSTKEPPKDADIINELSQLKPKHRHIIFNKKFQEGWDNPEAYIAYFDGETKSVTRIKQIIGRVIRQPGQKHVVGIPELNTAYLFVSAPDEKFAGIVDSLQRHLISEYATDDLGEANIRVTRRSQKPAAIPLRPGIPSLSVPNWLPTASGMDELIDRLRAAGKRPFPPDQLAAPGQARRQTFKLTEVEAKIVNQLAVVGEHIKSGNAAFFSERVNALSTSAYHWLDPDVLEGPMWQDESAARSEAQHELERMAAAFVDAWESRVRYAKQVKPDRATWTPTPLQPTTPKTVDFSRSAHVCYPDASSFMNKDERAAAEALDAVVDGWWVRTPPTAASGGYGIPLPIKLVSSNTFYPDFLWWVDGGCWAIDTTGAHIIGPKVRGKLLTLLEPRIALVTRGKLATGNVDLLESTDGWTLVLPGPSGARGAHYQSFGAVLAALRAE